MDQQTSSSQQPPSSPLPPIHDHHHEEAHHSQLAAIIAFGFLLLIIVGAGAFYLGTRSVKPPISQPTPTITYPTVSPTPDETAGWKTYINEEHGYSIKYPQDTLTRRLCPGEELVLSIKNANNPEDDTIVQSTCGRGGRYPIEVFVLKPEQKIDSNPKSNEFFNISQDTISIAGLKARRYKITPTDRALSEGPPPADLTTEVFLDYNGKTFVFIWTSYKAQQPLEEEFNKMLSTFKFTK